jgi:hypothetical protein
MDQNYPRDEATGAPQPGDPGGSDAAWNQAPPHDPSPSAAGGSSDAAAEYAAWSADTSYQQQPVAPPPPPADTGAYAAPPPQSATYSDPAQAYQQPQYYDQSAYGQGYQQGYDQSAYGQYQQPQYQQPQYQQPQYQQPQYYDPGQYQQPQYQQPQYYDPSLYGQQPGYYDQGAYQQPYPQPGYPQQPPPYAYAQPGQDAYWDQAQGGGGYNRSFLAVLAGWVLLTWGFVFGVMGALVVYFQSITEWLPDVALSADVNELIADVESTDDRIFALGGILLIIGLIQIIAAVGVFGHRRWGRAFAIVISLLGILAALGVFTISAGFEALDVGLEQAMEGEEGSVAASLFVFACYLLVFLGMVVGRRHFRRRGVVG